MSGIKHSTRVVDNIATDDLLNCNVCERWLPAADNFSLLNRDRFGAKLAYLGRCRVCNSMHPQLRKKHPKKSYAEISLMVRRAVLGGNATQPLTLKAAGHKRSSAPRKQSKREREAWKVIREERAKQRSTGGSIYLIAEAPGVPRTVADPVKVGYSDDPEGRPAGLQTGNPRPLHLIAHIDGTPADERKLHARFVQQNILGEWFRPTDELLSVFGLSRD